MLCGSPESTRFVQRSTRLSTKSTRSKTASIAIKLDSICAMFNLIVRKIDLVKDAGGQTGLSCLYGDLNEGGQTSLFIKSSWSAGVCHVCVCVCVWL